MKGNDLENNRHLSLKATTSAFELTMLWFKNAIRIMASKWKLNLLTLSEALLILDRSLDRYKFCNVPHCWTEYFVSKTGNIHTQRICIIPFQFSFYHLPLSYTFIQKRHALFQAIIKSICKYRVFFYSDSQTVGPKARCFVSLESFLIVKAQVY